MPKKEYQDISFAGNDMFSFSSIPMILVDFSVVREKCLELQRIELYDLDKYIYAEKLLKKITFKDFTIIDSNKSFNDIFDISNISNEFEKINLIFSGCTYEIVRYIVNEILSGDKSGSIDVWLLDIKGERFFATLYIDNYGDDYYNNAFISIIDINRFKQKDKRNKYINARYEILKNTITDSMLVVNLNDGKIIEVNSIALNLLNSLKSDLIGKDHRLLFLESDLEKFDNFFAQNLIHENKEESISISVYNGLIFIPVELRISFTVIDNLNIAQILFRNLSSQIKIEERRKMLSTAVDQVAESVIITDTKGNIQYVNPAFEEISGYSYAEVIGRNPKFLQSDEINASNHKLMWDEISNGRVWRGSFTNKKRNGEIYKEDVTITPVKDLKGIIVNYVAVKRDITKNSIIENQIRQSQKMQAIGTLAGGVAHDFNNILTAIMGYAELSQSQCEKSSLLYENLGEIIRATDRAGDLVDQILKFSRQSEKNISSLKISIIVKEALKLLRASLPANIDIISDISQEIYVKADPTQMHQIVMNLCTNAYQSLEGKEGSIFVRLKTRYLTPREGIEAGNLQHGEYVALQVEDNGVGIPKEYMSRIFEPYFTTKKMHEGTGLGLSVVHGIVNDHGGSVTVDSIPGKGSVFTVYLPQAKPEDVNIDKDNTIRHSNLGGHILVVDDEQPIVFFLVQILEHLGYSVEASTNSEKAYKIFAEQNGNFDLVITDMGMPGMTGLELSAMMKQINPKIPILLCTGFSEYVTADNYKQMGLSGFIAKPFNAENLAKEVECILLNT